MHLHIVAVGRARQDPAAALVDRYLGRLPWKARVTEVEARGRLDDERRRTREGDLLLAAVADRALIIALDGGGKALDSAAFASHLDEWLRSGHPEVAFLIGGADGLSDAARARARFMLSLGPMTWPHLLARAMLAEQIYRAGTIVSGHPYHRA
jgi:23S rRNA (pseudouridine1915-N3)-methyltransferase